MRVRVGDTILDQFRETVIAQTFETNDFGDLSTRNGGFSNDFTLPLSATNREALDFPDDINNIGRNPYQKVDAELIDVGAVISKGYLRYRVVSETQIECSFFSENTEWFNLIKDKKMSDLDLSSYDHDWTFSVIVAKISSNPTSGYVYPIIDYGYYIDETLSTTTDISADTLFPGMFVNTLVEQIFTDIGWTVSGNLLTEERYTRMIQPFSAPDFVHSQAYIDDQEQVTTKTLDQNFGGLGPNTVVTWAGAATNITWNGDNGKNDIIFSLIFVKNLGGLQPFSLFIKKNAATIYSDVFNDIPNDTWIITIEDEDLDNGDVITVELASTNSNAGTIKLGSTATIQLGAEIQYGAEVQMSETMPDITQADFLKYIFFAFGVVPQANNFSRNVSLTLFKGIKDNIPSALDWSDKLDLSKSKSFDFTQLLNNYSRISVINYEEDNDDPELSAYRAETAQNFGQGQFDIDNQHLDPEKEIYTSPYAPMININSFSNELYIPQIKWFIEDPDNPGEFLKEFEPMPKIALISELIPISTLSLNRATTFNFHVPGDTGTGATLADIPFTWFVKTDYVTETDALDYSLAFDPTAFTNENGTTLLVTYATEYEDLLNNMKYVKAFFKLTEVDINAIDFTIPIYIDHFKAYFYLNKTKDYRGSERATQVELIKIDNGG